MDDSVDKNLKLVIALIVIMAVLAGILKDVVWDKLLKKGTFEVLDIFFTGVGGVIGMAVAIILTNLLGRQHIPFLCEKQDRVR